MSSLSNSIRLALFFTEGVSLHTWDTVGMLDRELALYKFLAGNGVETEFITYGRRNEDSYLGGLSKANVRANSWGLPQKWYQTTLSLMPPKANVFKSNQILGANVAMKSAKRRRAKFVARCGYLLSEFQARQYGADSQEAKEAKVLEAEIFFAADRVVLTTRAMATSVERQYEIEKGKIRVIPNYVETDRFKPFQGRINKKPRIGFVGRLNSQKNPFELMEAVSQLDVELAIVGEGPLKAELEGKARISKATIKFLGNLPNRDLPKFLSSCDLFVIPSLYEGHPKALLEAMACGLPVIGTRVAGISELISDGENGLLCDTDANNIRDRIKRALEDDELRLSLGAKARAFAVENFSLERIAEIELSMFKELVLA